MWIRTCVKTKLHAVQTGHNLDSDERPHPAIPSKGTRSNAERRRCGCCQCAYAEASAVPRGVSMLRDDLPAPPRIICASMPGCRCNCPTFPPPKPPPIEWLLLGDGLNFQPRSCRFHVLRGQNSRPPGETARTHVADADCSEQVKQLMQTCIPRGAAVAPLKRYSYCWS